MVLGQFPAPASSSLHHQDRLVLVAEEGVHCAMWAGVGLVHPVSHVESLALDSPHQDGKEWQPVQGTVTVESIVLEAGMEQGVEEVVLEL